MKQKGCILILIIYFIFIFSCKNIQEKIDVVKKNKNITVGFTHIDNLSDWEYALNNSILIELKKHNINIEFYLYEMSDSYFKKAIDRLKMLIDGKKIDCAIIRIYIPEFWINTLTYAKTKKQKIILIGSSVNDESLYTTFIGNNFSNQGRLLAQWLVDNYERIRLQNKPIDTINIVELQGTNGSIPAIDRKRGFEEIIIKYPNYKIIKSKDALFNKFKGKEVMGEFLKTDGKNIDVVFAHNDDMVLGAIQAIEEYGLTPGKDIIILSIDGSRDAFQAMIDGKLNCTVECNMEYGPVLADTIEKISNGKKVPKTIYIKDRVFPQETAKDLIDTRKY